MFEYDYKDPFWTHYDIRLPNPLEKYVTIQFGIGPVSKPEYRFLKAGEVTQEGDEVEVGTPWNGLQWEKVRNGNLNLCVGKYQEDIKCYRRKTETQKAKENPINPREGFRILKEGEIVQKGDEVTLHGNVWSFCNVSIGDVVDSTDRVRFRRAETLAEAVHNVWPRTYARLEELQNEVKTLKDQLANAMAEVNELKARVPDYVYLMVGDKILAGDEVLIGDQWVLSCASGYGNRVSLVGDYPTHDVTGKQLEYRRKVK